MSYQHPSGATKRKRKREEMLSLKKIQKSLFFNPAPKQSQPSEFRGQRSQDASRLLTVLTQMKKILILSHQKDVCIVLTLLSLLQSKCFIEKITKVKRLEQPAAIRLNLLSLIFQSKPKTAA